MNRGATGVYWERPHSQTWLSTSLHFVAATRRGRARRAISALPTWEPLLRRTAALVARSRPELG